MDVPEEAKLLLIGDMVDLDLFAGGATVYELTDAHGNPRSFEIPNDIPFPLVLGLLRAFDEWSVASGTSEGETAWMVVLGRMAAIIALRNDPLPAQALNEEIGPAKLTGWINAVVMRCQMAQAGMNLEGFYQRLLAAAEESTAEVDGPKAPDPSRSAASSADSGGSTDGPTTTGAP